MSSQALPSDYRISDIDVQIPREVGTLRLISPYNVNGLLPTCLCSFMPQAPNMAIETACVPHVMLMLCVMENVPDYFKLH